MGVAQASGSEQKMNVREMEFAGWKALELTGERYTLIVPLEIGLRIPHCIFITPPKQRRTPGSPFLL